MRPSSSALMIEATRLTREGRLQEAMALLQGRPDARGEPAPSGDGSPLIDLAAPPPGTDGAWTDPLAPGRPPARPEGAAAQRAGLAGLRDRLSRRPGARGARAAPTVSPAGARFEERLFAGAGGSRPYRLYVPSTAAGRALPLVVMLHGCTQDPVDFAAGTRMNELAEAQGLLVAYPAQTPAANASRCWNWFSPGDQRRDGGEPALIAGITRAVLAEQAVARGRVYVAGLSAGGAAAAIMGAAYPDLFAAVGVHSGLACGAARDLPSALAAMRQGGGSAGPGAGGAAPAVPTIVFHGDRDGTVHPVNGDKVAARSGAGRGLRAETERGRSEGGRAWTRTVHRDAAGRSRLEQWVLHGAGHAWSGGSPAGSYTDPAGPDASREMLRFFAQHEGPGGD